MPAGWPGDLIDPDSPDFEYQSLQWVLDRLPDAFRTAPCKSDPVALVWILQSLLENQISALRVLNGTARTQSGVTDITGLMESIAYAEAILMRDRREMELVKSAVEGNKGKNREVLLD